MSSSQHSRPPSSSSSSMSQHNQVGEPGPSRAHATQSRPSSSGSSSSAMSQQSQIGQPGPSREAGVAIRPRTSDSSSSEMSHHSQVGQPGPSVPRSHSGPPPSSKSASLKSHRSQLSGAPGLFEPAFKPLPQESDDEMGRDPLDGEAVDEMRNKDARAKLIIERANLWMQSIHPPGVDHSTYRAAIKDATGRFQYKEFPDPKGHKEFPRQELKEMFPIPEDRDRENRARFNPDAATVRKNFDDVRNEFQQSKLGQILQNIVRDKLLVCKLEKIVAFGAGTICPPYEPTHHISKAHRNRHAALLAIRDILRVENTSKAKQTEIFLQDASYTRLDREVLGKYGMTVVNGDIGCQAGFVLADKKALVVVFDMPSDIFPLFWETSRPAAFLCGTPLDKSHHPDAPVHYVTLHRFHEGEREIKPVDVPGPGTNMWDSMDKMLGDYHDTTKISLKHLNLGTLNGELSEKPTLDGHNGVTHLGPQPILYIRMTQLPSENWPRGWGQGGENVGMVIPNIKVPEYGIQQEPLKWRDLLRPEQRELKYPEIIKRINLLTYVNGLIFADTNEWDNCKRKAKETGCYSKERSREFKTPNLEKVMVMYRLRPVEHDAYRGMHIRDTIKSGKTANPDPNKLAENFRKHIHIFQKSELCRRIKLLVSKLFHEHKVNKIVAFGLGNLSVPFRDPDSQYAVHLHSQHAALLAIRDAWTAVHRGAGKFDIYVQDPQYSKQDEDILKQHDITVVNSNMGYQVGACLLDLYTLVVDFVALWPVPHVVFETTRPAGILRSHPIEIELEMGVVEQEAIFHYEMAPWTGYNEEIMKGGTKVTSQKTNLFPGTGVSDAEVIQEGLNDYRFEMLDMTGLDIGEEHLYQKLAADPSYADAARKAEERNAERRAAAGGSTSAATPGSSKGKRPAGVSNKLTKPHPSSKGKATSASHATSATSTKPQESSKGETKGLGHLFGRLGQSKSQRTDYEDPKIRRDGSNFSTFIGYEPVLYTRLASAETLLKDNTH